VSRLEHVVVVGASLAGLNAVEELRRRGFAGRLTVVGAEPHLPYDRPPLSKKYLAGQIDDDKVVLRGRDHFDGLDVAWRTGVPAVALDAQNRRVELDDGSAVTGDAIVIATGAAPRRLPGQADFSHVHELRTLDDSIRLGAELRPGGRRVVVIGAGFIGLEVAATARSLGNDVLVLEGAPAPLMRALGPTLGSAVAAVHGDHDVEIRCGVSVGGFAEGGLIADGALVAADAVVVGIGVAPATGWLEGSGLELRDGVVCGPDLNAGHAGVWAAGDIVRWTNQLFGEEMRIEHWTNAVDQGVAVAANLLAAAEGAPTEPFAPVPFFWSEQYDRRIQFIGLGNPADEIEIVAGSVDERRFVALVGSGGRLRGALGMNMPKVALSFRASLAEGSSWDAALAKAAEVAAPAGKG